MEKYDATAFFYDQRYFPLQLKKFEFMEIQHLYSNKIILDAGCGTGLLHEHFKNKFQGDIIVKAFHVGVDLSWNMLKLFQKKLKVNPPIKNVLVCLIQGDMEHLPFRDESFSSIFAFTSLQNLPELSSGIKELVRVSQGGSSMLVSILKKSVNSEIIKSEFSQYFSYFEILNEESLEDVIFSCKVK
ncbi:MAG: class I SAM-dependent methyltransferase [Promethearchaeota archaeon]